MMIKNFHPVVTLFENIAYICKSKTDNHNSLINKTKTNKETDI